MLTSILCSMASGLFAPSLSLSSLFDARLGDSGAEPSIMLNKLQLVDPPEGEFKVKVVVRSGEEAHGETISSQIYRAENMSAVQLRVKSIPLGTTEGARTVSVLIDDQPAGHMDFTVKRAGEGWAFDGPWSRYAQIRWVPGGNASSRVRFVYWAAGYEFPNPKQPFRAVFKRYGKVLAEGQDKYPSDLVWTKRTDNLRKPNGSYVGVPDVASLGNGPLTIDIVQGGKTVKSFKASIAGGKFVSSKLPALEGSTLAPREVTDAMNKLSPDTIVWIAP